MSDSRDPGSYYYSTYHLARDFIGTAAPFTLFLTFATFLFSPVSEKVRSASETMLRAQSWVTGLFFVGIYLLIASMAGVLCQRFALMFRILWSSLRKRNLEYEALYEENEQDIENLYKKYIRIPELLLVKSTDKRVDFIDRLCTYFRLHNPQGYNHLYREYSLASMYRQAVVYSLLLSVGCMVEAHPWYGIVFFLASVGLGFAIHYTVRDVARTEYEFILATAAWAEQSKPGR